MLSISSISRILQVLLSIIATSIVLIVLIKVCAGADLGHYYLVDEIIPPGVSRGNFAAST